MLIRESAEQIPHLTQTVVSLLAGVGAGPHPGSSWVAGRGMARTGQRGEEDGQEAEENVGGAHGGSSESLFIWRWNDAESRGR